MQNTVRVPKKPSQGGPKHCEGTKKIKKTIFQASWNPASSVVTGWVPWGLENCFFLFFWYPHSVLGLLDLVFLVFLVPSQCFACKSLVLFSKTNVFVWKSLIYLTKPLIFIENQCDTGQIAATICSILLFWIVAEGKPMQEKPIFSATRLAWTQGSPVYIPVAK